MSLSRLPETQRKRAAEEVENVADGEAPRAKRAKAERNQVESLARNVGRSAAATQAHRRIGALDITHGINPVSRPQSSLPKTVDALVLPRRVDLPKHPQPLAPDAVLHVPNMPVLKARAQEYLQWLETPHPGVDCAVRIILEPAEDRMGHQASALQALLELQALGYNPPVEVVCLTPESRDKFVSIFGNRDASRIRLVDMDDAHGKAKLTLVPALDEPEVLDEVLASLTTSHQLVLEPFLWPEPRIVHDGIEAADLRLPEYTAAYQPRLADYPHIAPWLAEQFGMSPAQGLQSPFIQAAAQLHRAVSLGQLNVAAVYGQFTDRAIGPWIEVLRRSQAGAADRQGTLVLWFDSELPSDIPATLPTLHLGAEGFSRSIEQIVSRSQPIALCQLGKVPQAIFNEFMAMSTWPVLTEGRSTANLMRVLQRPYIALFDPEDQDVSHEEATFALLQSPHAPPGSKIWSHAWDHPDKGLVNGEYASRALMGGGDLNDALAFVDASQQPGSHVVLGYAGAGRQNLISDQLQMGLAQLAEKPRS